MGQVEHAPDTCKQIYELDEDAAGEYVKCMLGQSADTTKFYHLICDCQHVDRRTDGQLIETGRMKNCEREGTWTVYGDSLSVVRVTNYSRGKRHGEFIAYWGSGQLAMRCNYRDDQYDGPYEEYDYDGNLVRQAIYSMGCTVSDTIAKEWKPDGVVEYIWPVENIVYSTRNPPGVHLWENGQRVFLRALDPNELATQRTNEDLTKKAREEYYERKRKP